MSIIHSLWIKPTDVLNSNFIGSTTLHVSGSLSAHHQEFLALHRFWYILCSCDDRLLPGVGWNCSSILLLVVNSHQNCIKCTKTDVRLRIPDDGQRSCPNMLSRNTNKIGIQYICWFYSQGISYDARSYDHKTITQFHICLHLCHEIAHYQFHYALRELNHLRYLAWTASFDVNNTRLNKKLGWREWQIIKFN